MWVLNIEARSCACALSHQQALSHLSSSINVYVVIVGLLLFGTGLRSSLASNLVGIFLANPISYQNLLSTVKISVLQITHFWVTGSCKCKPSQNPASLMGHKACVLPVGCIQTPLSPSLCSNNVSVSSNLQNSRMRPFSSSSLCPSPCPSLCLVPTSFFLPI